MRLKIIAISFLTLATITNASAQNTTMAKAYLKKAQEAMPSYGNDCYEYQEAFDYIEKCKELLNGKTNPEIIYLEAKVRYKLDKDLVKTKELINQFMTEAFETDKRIEEFASLLIEIEDSDDFCKDGNRKRFSYIGRDGNIIEEKYNDNCSLTSLYAFKNDYSKSKISEIQYKEGVISEKTIYEDNEDYRTITYENGKEVEIRKYSSDYKIKESSERVSSICWKTEKYKFNNYDLSYVYQTIWNCENDKVIQTRIVKNDYCYDKEIERNYDCCEIKIIDKKTNTIIFTASKMHISYELYDNGFVKAIWDENRWYYYADIQYHNWSFTENGYPKAKWTAKGRKTKQKTYKLFNISTFSWE